MQAALTGLLGASDLGALVIGALVTWLPLAVAFAGVAGWREGIGGAGVLTGFAVVCWIWLILPVTLAPAEVAQIGGVVSVLGWIWLIASWARRVQWSGRTVLAANALVVAMLLTLTIVLALVGLRNLTG